MSRISGMVMVVAALWCGGCERRPEDTVPRPPSAPTSRPAPVVVKPAEVGLDDPATPAWLPRATEIAGWVRSGPVRVLRPGAWEALENDDLRRRLEAFRVGLVLALEYTAVPAVAPPVTARAWLIESVDPADSYGVFASLAPLTPPDHLIGVLSHFTRRPDGETAVGWQGTYTVYAVSRHDVDGAPPISLEMLAAGLVRPIPSAPLPDIVQLLPSDHRLPGQVWVARRHLEILPETIRKDVLRGSSVEMTKALGLHDDTLAVVAGYAADDHQPPLYVWLVHYPTPTEMVQAIGRVKSMVRRIKPSPPILMETPRDVDGQPVGRYLCGTWNPEHEAVAQLLQAIIQRLPAAPSAPAAGTPPP